MYRVLWIDDEHEGLDPIKTSAKINGIELVAYTNKEEGLDELERHFRLYDGVLLDGKIFEKPTDEPGSEDDKHTWDARDRIRGLPKPFKIFVLSGNTDFLGNEKYNQRLFDCIFEKGYELGPLFDAIKEAADKHIDTQIRRAYSDVFETFDDKYFGKETEYELLRCIELIESGKKADILNPIRKLMDDLFITFSDYGLIPYSLTSPTVELNKCSRFLQGKNREGNYHQDSGFKHFDDTHLPAHIAEQIRHILAVVQPGSHRTLLDEHIAQSKKNYLQRGLLLELFDLLVWAREYLDSEPKKKNWKEI